MKNSNKNLHWSWGRILTSRPISTNFYSTVKLTRAEGIKTTEITGHGFFFVADYIHKKYWLWHSNKPSESTKARVLPKESHNKTNTLGLHQNGRDVHVFFNSKHLDSFKLVDPPVKGRIGLYFKTDPILGGKLSFERFNIWEL